MDVKKELDAKRKKLRKFVRYSEGAEMYGMSEKKFSRMAKEAKATYKLNRMVLVNLDIFDKYLETFRIVE
jgi:hypothetical protein